MPTGQCILNEDIHLESPKDFWSPYRLVCLSFLLSYMGNLDLSCSFGVTATGKAVGMSRFFLFSFSVPNQDFYSWCQADSEQLEGWRPC